MKFCFLVLIVFTSLISGCQTRGLSGAKDIPVAPFFAHSIISDISTDSKSDSVLMTRTRPGKPAAVFVYESDNEAFARLSHADGIARQAIEFLPGSRAGQYRYLFSATAADGGTHIKASINGHIIDLTPGRQVHARFLGFSATRRDLFLALSYAGADGVKVQRYRTDNFASVTIFENPMKLNVSAVSPDGRYVAGKKVISNNHHLIYVADVTYAEPVIRWRGNAQGDNGWYTPLTFTPDSEALVFTSDDNTPYQQSYLWELHNDNVTDFLPVEGNVTAVRFGKNQTMAAEHIIDGRQYVTVFNQKKQKLFTTAGDRNSWRPRFLAASGRWIVLQADDRHVPTPVIFDNHQNSEQLFSTGEPTTAVSSQEVFYFGFDGLKIPARLYRPPAASSEAPVPAVVYAHSGFDNYFATNYHPHIQHLVASGYAVLAVNYRGSAGFGRQFRQVNDNQQGVTDTRDIISGGRFIAGLPWVQANNIAVAGHNYGGFLALSSLMQSDVFRAGVDAFGVTNWLTFLQSVPSWLPDYHAYLSSEFGEPERNSQRLEAISPVFHAERFQVPVLIAQGEKDPYVPRTQTDDFVAALNTQGTTVEYVVFANEGHGLNQTRNQIILQQRIIAFLQQHLLSENR